VGTLGHQYIAACHPERSEGSPQLGGVCTTLTAPVISDYALPGGLGKEVKGKQTTVILRFAQDDS